MKDGEEKKILTISLLLSFVGLSLIYFAAVNVKPKEIDLNEINFELVGRSVTTVGEIVYKKEHPAGHIFLSLAKENTRVQVPIFAGLRNELEKEFNLTELKEGRKLRVTGLVGEYRGQLQIIPRKCEDLEVIG